MTRRGSGEEVDGSGRRGERRSGRKRKEGTFVLL